MTLKLDKSLQINYNLYYINFCNNNSEAMPQLKISLITSIISTVEIQHR